MLHLLEDPRSAAAQASLARSNLNTLIQIPSATAAHHTSHVTRHTSHVTRHTSHVTYSASDVSYSQRNANACQWRLSVEVKQPHGNRQGDYLHDV
jgi:hypothetical protein